MDQVPIGLVILIVVFLIFLSAFFSSAEAAFLNLNKIRLRNYVEEEKKGSKKALYISENFDKTIATILIGNNFVNIAATSIVTLFLINQYGPNTGLLAGIIGMTIIILVFGEILPKSLAKEYAESYSLKIAGILYIVIQLLTPLNFIFRKFKSAIQVLSKNKISAPSVREEELKVLVDISEEEGIINKSEKELLHRTLDFNEIIVGEILTHRLDIVAIEVEMPLEEITSLLLEERYSRIPVYEDNIDNIIGFLSEREFFAELVTTKDVNIREFIRKPIFVVKSMKISTLLPELQRTKSHMAIVLDEFGGTAGLITMEDILEELVGEIWDEHDEKINFINRLSENVFELNAQMHLDDFAELFQIKSPESTYYNVGGWIFELSTGVPKEGDVIQYKNLKITMIEVENHRLQKVRVERVLEFNEAEKMNEE